MALSRARLKQLRALGSAKGRHTQGAFLIEGEKLVREAVAAGAPLLELLGTATQRPALDGLAAEILASRGGPGVAVSTLSAADAERLSDTRTPQGSFALIVDTVPDAAEAIAALPASGAVTVLALDGVQDPGNAGALIRVAAAFGADLVLAGGGSADPVQPKVVRAATGAWFRQPLARAPDLVTALTALTTAGCAIVGASPRGESVAALAVPLRRVLVLGSEGGGFSAAVAERLALLVAAPIAPAVESLNVAVAAGIILSTWQQGVSNEGGRGCAS